MIENPAHLLHEKVVRHWAPEHEAHRVRVRGLAGIRSRPNAHWLALVAIAPAILISAFDMTTLNVALPALTRSLHATTSDLQWIVDSYTIVLAGLLLFAQGVGDRFGRKGTYMSGAVIFGVASFVAAFTHSPPPLILARAVMGVGAALLLSPTLAMIAVIFPPAERPKAVTIWVICGGVGTSLGPVLGGALVDGFGWGAVFLINVPVIMFALVAAAVLLPTSRKPGDVHLDVVGMLLSIVGLSVLLYGVIEGPHRGWFAPGTLGTIVLGLLLSAAFIGWELRSRDPMFDPRVFRSPGVMAGAAALFGIYVAFLGMLFIVPQYLQFVADHSALETGLLMLPFGISFIVFAQAVRKIVLRLGAEKTLVLGMGTIVAGLVLISLFNASGSYLPVAVGTLIIGSGLGLSVGPATTVVVNSLPLEKAGDGSSVNMLMRQTGAAFGVAIVGSVFATIYANQISPFVRGLSAADAESARRSVQGAEQVLSKLSSSAAQILRGAADDSFVAAARGGLLAAALVVGICGLIALNALRHREDPAHPAAVSPDAAPAAE